MAATIRVPGYTAATKKQARIYAAGVGTVVLPWWPDEIARSAIAPIYETQDRPGRTPLLLRSGDSLPEVRVGCLVSTNTAEVNGVGNVSAVLAALIKASKAKKPVSLKLASRSGRYRVTDLGITELDWDTTGQPISAEVSMTLVSASDAVVPVGPIKKKPKR